MIDGGVGVDHIVDSRFRDDETVTERLAFWGNVARCVLFIKPLWVLPSVIGCEIANDVRVGRIAQYERIVVMHFKFLVEYCKPYNSKPKSVNLLRTRYRIFQKAFSRISFRHR